MLRSSLLHRNLADYDQFFQVDKTSRVKWRILIYSSVRLSPLHWWVDRRIDNHFELEARCCGESHAVTDVSSAKERSFHLCIEMTCRKSAQ